MSTPASRHRPFDERGNLIAQAGTLPERASVTFQGRHNRLVLDGTVPLDKVSIRFLGSDAQVVVGALAAGSHLSLDLEVADGASVQIGADVTTVRELKVRTAAGATVRIGEGARFARGAEILADAARGLGPRADDTRHDVSIGARVRFLDATQVRAGADIGDDAVLEMVPLVDDTIPAAALVRGLPATVVRTLDPARLALD